MLESSLSNEGPWRVLLFTVGLWRRWRSRRFEIDRDGEGFGVSDVFERVSGRLTPIVAPDATGLTSVLPS